MKSSETLKTNPSLSTEQARTCIDAAFKIFDASTTDPVTRRNEVVGTLRIASDMACSQFTQHLNSMQADANLASGILATGLAGAGAIFTSAATARALSGSAGIVTGVRAEIDADVFFREAAPVIANAIVTKRDTLRQDLDGKLTSSISQYPIENAVSDVIRYNDACSLVAGLYAANNAIALAESPGIDALNRTLLKVNLARQIAAHPDYTDSSVIKSDGTGNQGVVMTLGSNSGNTSPTSDPQTAYQASMDAITVGLGGAKATIAGVTISDATAAATQSTIQHDIDTVSTTATGTLQNKCQATAVTRHSNIVQALVDASNKTGSDAIQAGLKLNDARTAGSIFATGVTAYKDAVVSRVSAAQQDFMSAATAFVSGNAPDKGDSSRLQTATSNVHTNLTTLNTNLSAAGSLQPSCP